MKVSLYKVCNFFYEIMFNRDWKKHSGLKNILLILVQGARSELDWKIFLRVFRLVRFILWVVGICIHLGDKVVD
jgi:hypothetical protein